MSSLIVTSVFCGSLFPSKSWLREHVSPGWSGRSPWTGQLSTEARHQVLSMDQLLVSVFCSHWSTAGQFCLLSQDFPESLPQATRSPHFLISWDSWRQHSQILQATRYRKDQRFRIRHQMWVNHRAGLHFKEIFATWVLGFWEFTDHRILQICLYISDILKLKLISLHAIVSFSIPGEIWSCINR